MMPLLKGGLSQCGTLGPFFAMPTVLLPIFDLQLAKGVQPTSVRTGDLSLAEAPRQEIQE